MIIIIDGYNLLKHIFPGVKNSSLDKQKIPLIRQLTYYKTSKDRDIKEILIVFDAGPSNHATRSVKSGVVIVYSGSRSSADDWILSFVERNKNNDVLVVTLDRALREACCKLGADWLDVYEFYNILQQRILSDLQTTTSSDDQEISSLEKYENITLDEMENHTINTVALDLLMEQAAGQLFGEKATDQTKEQSPRTKKSYTLSKKEKRIQGKLKKLQ